MSVTRKDYGAAAIVPDSNEAYKRALHVNQPHSLQSTGALRQGDYVESKDISFATIKAGMRVLTGNAEGIVTSVTFTGVTPNEVLDTVTIAFEQPGKADPRVEVKSVAALQASGNYFFVQNK